MELPDDAPFQEGYTDWKRDNDNKFVFCEYRYKTYKGEERKQHYIYFHRFHPKLPWCGYVYNPRTKQIWGAALPANPPGEQYALLDRPITWDEIGGFRRDHLPRFGPLPVIPPEGDDTVAGPVLETPPLPPAWAEAERRKWENGNPPQPGGGSRGHNPSGGYGY